MTNIRVVDYDQSSGLLRELYDHELQRDGFVAEDTRVFSLRPDVYAAWEDLKGKIRSHMRLRRYELVTMAAAAALGCEY